MAQKKVLLQWSYTYKTSVIIVSYFLEANRLTEGWDDLLKTVVVW